MTKSGKTIWEQTKVRHPDSFNLVCPRCGRPQVNLKAHLWKYHKKSFEKRDIQLLLDEARPVTNKNKPLDALVARFHQSLLTSGRSRTKANNISKLFKKFLSRMGATQDNAYLMLAIQDILDKPPKKMTSNEDLLHLFADSALFLAKSVSLFLKFLADDEINTPHKKIQKAKNDYMTYIQELQN